MSNMPEFQIAPVRAGVDLAFLVKLFRDYAASLSIDLSLQAFESELASLPGAYSPPRSPSENYVQPQCCLPE